MAVERRGARATQARWASGLNVVAGLWLIISPFVLGFGQPGQFGVAPGAMTQTWDAIVVGIIVTILAGFRAADPVHRPAWLSWLNLVLAAWLVISPFVLGFSGAQPETTNALVMGVIIGVLAIWSGLAMPAGMGRTEAGAMR